MAGRTRSRSVTYGQLMLFAALLFGIVTMHTVGHPAEHGGSPVSAPAMTEHMAQAPGQDRAPGPVPAPGVADAQQSPRHDSAGSGAPMSGMDPLSVCLAVLGVWGLALVGSWLLGLRADGRPLGTPVGAGLLRVLRPIPPPRISVLASVSVLRI
ncbi:MULTISPECIES: hypothetical protein [Streptomyces]|uniref:hypothetical protein n=1 Tax=Streptomyces TaxID=1883 RepID=UPI0009396AC1|nr:MULTISPECIES: hypothetical protein [unclassified Streptomyces]OKJ12889.1 hypothetical protein AMK20_11135 [Streptomyces sp. TSRI0261]QNQ36905.1 hypothetical protein HYC88_26675 [Streptomyces sp. CB00271]